MLPVDPNAGLIFVGLEAEGEGMDSPLAANLLVSENVVLSLAE